MKKHVLPILLAFLLVIPAILLLWGFALPTQYGETFLGQLSAQVDRLSESPGQRIILVGGSSVPFSLRCDLLEAALPGYTVIDFGLYADIGTSVMLELLEPELRSGDLVIIAPEQNALNNNWSADSLWQGLDGRFDLLVGDGTGLGGAVLVDCRRFRRFSRSRNGRARQRRRRVGVMSRAPGLDRPQNPAHLL